MFKHAIRKDEYDMADKPLLEVKDLVIHYETDDGVVKALNGVNIHIGVGETLGLVGETGAGKTTLAKGIMRLIPHPPGRILGGEVIFEGQDLLKLSTNGMEAIRGRDISMIFQDPMTSLNPLQTVGEQIGEMILLHNHFSKQELSNQVDELMEKVGLPKGRKTEYPHQFSGGMKQRVVIAIALACNPKLLIADEPTTALDVTIQAQILNLMEDLKREYHTSMLLITHDLGIVVEMCDKVAIMYAGEIVESGSVEQIYSTPLHPYTQGLFNSVPSLDDDKHRLTPIDGLMPDPTNLPAGCHFHPRCPYATELCKTSPPASEAENGHRVMCWYWEKQKEGN